MPKSKKVAASPAVPSPPPIQSGEDFPSLSQSSKSKKQSVITVVPTWGQNSSQSSNNNNNNNNAKTTTDLTKGKTKKKKIKQQTLNGSSTIGNESNGSGSNASATVAKKDVESTRACNSDDSRMSKRCSQITHATNNGTNNDNTSKSSSVQNLKEQPEHINKKDKRKNKNNADSCGEDGSGASLVNTKSANGMQRKRSELKIDSLSTTNNNIHPAEDFSTLSSSTSISRPPGFSNPPGFGSLTTPPPPPGFSVKYNSIEQLHGSNGLTFTNSSGESYSILPSDDNHGHTYASPPDFQKRNASLAARLNEVLVQQEKIEKFRYVSSLFRGGSCNAEKYYMHCREVMGASTFENVFAELLVLLPDIAKQQELFKVHKREVGGKAKGLEMCARCGQVLKNGSDFGAHMSSHTLENHFPALGKSNIPPPKNTWVRK